ncbi:MAG: hypothetical protein V7459_09065 [Oceanicoccus sp.]
MSINPADLSTHVIKPTLDYLGVQSGAAEKLLLGTAAQESNFDPFSEQHDGIGIFQITPKEHRQAWDNYLAFQPELASKVRGLASQHQFLRKPDQELKTNLAYSTAIAWIIYLQSDLQLPEADDVDGLSLIWEANFCHREQCQAEDFARWISAHVAA